MINKIPMRLFAKLFVLILFIGLPIFIFSTNKVSAALKHSCGAIKGTCKVSGLTYNVKFTYNDALKQYEWKCGFGNDAIACNNAKFKNPLIPPPGKNNNKGDKEQEKGDIDHYEKEYKETSTKTIGVKFCPCPECGDKHYECTNGNPNKWSHAVEKNHENKDVWTWRCLDSCGNASVQCREEKSPEDPECDESQCKYSNSCLDCAKCLVGEPVITTSADGECYWYCGVRDEHGRLKRNEAFCHAEKIKDSKCGQANGTYFSKFGAWWKNDDEKVYVNYLEKDSSGVLRQKTQTLNLCQPGYSLCDDVHFNTFEDKGIINKKYIWTCCYGGCSKDRRMNGQCDTCSAWTSSQDWDIRLTTKENTTHNLVTTGGNSNSVSTVGRGLFMPSSGWFH